MSPILRPFAPAAAQTIDSKSLTVSEAINLYIAHDSKRLGRCATSARDRENLLLKFCESFGNRLVKDCCAGDLQFWMDSHETWKSDWTLLRVLRTIQRPFNWLAKLGVLSRNPFQGLSHCNGERGRPMEVDEFRLFLRNTDACFRRVLIFLRFCGCRPGELRGLEWDYVHFDQATAVLWRHKTRHSRRDKAPRILFLHPVCVKLLIWIKRHQPQGQKFVFLNCEGTPWTKSALDLRLYRLRRKLGVDPSCKLYGCRHEWATQLALNGVDVATLAELLGHTSATMAMHYVHVAGRKDHLQAAVLKAFPRKE